MTATTTELHRKPKDEQADIIRKQLLAEDLPRWTLCLSDDVIVAGGAVLESELARLSYPRLSLWELAALRAQRQVEVPRVHNRRTRIRTNQRPY